MSDIHLKTQKQESLEQKIMEWTIQLNQVRESLNRDTQKKIEFDRLIQETESAYNKV